MFPPIHLSASQVYKEESRSGLASVMAALGRCSDSAPCEWEPGRNTGDPDARSPGCLECLFDWRRSSSPPGGRPPQIPPSLPPGGDTCNKSRRRRLPVPDQYPHQEAHQYPHLTFTPCSAPTLPRVQTASHTNVRVRCVKAMVGSGLVHNLNCCKSFTD